MPNSHQLLCNELKFAFLEHKIFANIKIETDKLQNALKTQFLEKKFLKCLLNSIFPHFIQKSHQNKLQHYFVHTQPFSLTCLIFSWVLTDRTFHFGSFPLLPFFSFLISFPTRSHFLLSLLHNQLQTFRRCNGFFFRNKENVFICELFCLKIPVHSTKMDGT